MRLDVSGAGTAVRSHFKSMHFRLETARLSVRRQINFRRRHDTNETLMRKSGKPVQQASVNGGARNDGDFWRHADRTQYGKPG
jgi:hypothetical protein